MAVTVQCKSMQVVKRSGEKARTWLGKSHCGGGPRLVSPAAACRDAGAAGRAGVLRIVRWTGVPVIPRQVLTEAETRWHLSPCVCVLAMVMPRDAGVAAAA